MRSGAASTGKKIGEQGSKKEKMNFGGMNLPVPTAFGDALNKIVYFEKERGDGPTISKYLLGLIVGIMGGLIPNLMNPEFKDKLVAGNRRALHLLLVMVIFSSVLGNTDTFDTYDRVLIATAVIYVWFCVFIQCAPKYMAMVLGALAVAQIAYRFRRGLQHDSSLIPTLKSLEVYITLAALLLTVGFCYMTNKQAGVGGIFKIVFGDLMDARKKEAAFGETTTFGDTTASNYDFN
jgi:hypothetical protein